MLRINTEPGSAAEVTLRVEGRLVGEWGPFLERHCRSLVSNSRTLRLDLAGVTYVDARGIDTLKRLTGVGVEFRSCPPIITDLLDEDIP